MSNCCDISSTPACKCCGCGGCENICPQNAIVMKENCEGFLVPYIEQGKCVKCGLCKKVCSAYTGDSDRYEPIKTYAAFSNTKHKRKNGSSGGVFGEIASYVIQKGGVVFGAKMHYDGKRFEVKHIGVEDEAKLLDLSGSKYLQSNVGNTYKVIATLLKEEKLVLFSGTPCQIATLKKYLNDDNEKLITVEIVCHGVPSDKVFNEYINSLEQKYNKKIVEYKFRTKHLGRQRIQVIFENGDRKWLKPELDSYWNFFCEGNLSRESCYNCQFASKKRVSDITLGDYWGVYEHHKSDIKKWGRNVESKGISCVMLNTAKGEKIWDKCKKNITNVESEYINAAKYNPQLSRPSHRGRLRDVIYENIAKEGYENTVVKLWKVSVLKKIQLYIESQMSNDIKSRIKYLIYSFKKQ